MSYATIEDVEKRLGYDITEEDQPLIQAFLDDYSLFLGTVIEGNSLTPSDEILKTITARHAVTYIKRSEIEGLSALTEAVGDTSRTQSFTTSGDSSSLFWLSKGDKQLLGLGNGGRFITFEVEVC